jgi:prepilin-type processing-associated H-X9-DG protein
MPRLYVCPSHQDYETTVFTDDVVVTGPETAFPGGKAMKLGEIGDGTANTLLVVETANTRIHWMEPRDLDLRTMSPRINDSVQPGISSPHNGGAFAAFCDGSVNFLENSLAPDHLRAYLTATGGEHVNRD